MRAAQVQLTTTIKEVLQPNTARQFIMFRNEDAVNTAAFQVGASSGNVNDFFLIKPGEVFTFDPQTSETMLSMLQQSWWFAAITGTASLKILVA